MKNIPCRWLDCWTENQSPLGSGKNWPMQMSECGHPNENHGDKCGPDCLGYELMEVAVCEKHGKFIKEYGCDSCMADDCEAIEKSAKEYYGAMKWKAI